MPPPLPHIAPPPGLVVSGAAGRIGRLLARIWAGSDVVWHARGDGALAAALAGRRALLCLSGVTSGDAAALAGNTDAARGALAAARGAGLGRVLLMSSSAVYGRTPGRLTEATPPAPANTYGAAKLAMEGAALDAPEAVVLRLGNVAGADALLGRLTDDDPTLDVFFDPSGTMHGPRRNYLGPVTLANLFSGLAAHPGPLPRILNLGAPGLVDMADLLAAAGRDWTPRIAPPEALAEVALDTGLLQTLLPLPPDAAAPSRIVAEWREAMR